MGPYPGYILRAGLACCSLFALAGCGGSDRPALAAASGIVTLDGTPVEGATVSYVPVTGCRPATAITDATGRYTMNAFADDEGAAVGDHKVTVMKISGPGASTLQGAAPPESTGDASEDDGSMGLSEIAFVEDDGNQRQPETIYHVPERYMNAETSLLTVTVPSGGSDSLDLKLTK